MKLILIVYKYLKKFCLLSDLAFLQPWILDNPGSFQLWFYEKWKHMPPISSYRSISNTPIFPFYPMGPVTFFKASQYYFYLNKLFENSWNLPFHLSLLIWHFWDMNRKCQSGQVMRLDSALIFCWTKFLRKT